MAAQIEINAGLTESAELLYFFQKYKEHNAIVASMPAAWKKTAAESKKHAQNEEDAAEAAKEHLSTLDKLNATMSKFHQLSVSTAQAWLTMQRNTLNVAGNIASATASLLKWAGVTALIGSVVGGAGGLFGMDELASRVSGQRTSAMGLGTTIGAQKSFTNNYSRYGDPSGILARASEAKSSVNNRSAFRAMGFTDREIDTMDPTELAAQFMERTAQRSQRETDPSHLEDWMRSRGVDKVMDVHTLQNLRTEGAGNRAKVYERYQKDIGRYSLPPDVARKWQTLSYVLKGAGDAIETTFIKALAGLNPVLTRISAAFMRIIDDLLPQVKEDSPLARWLTGFATCIEDTAKYLEGTGPKTSLISFFEGLKAIGIGIWDFVKKAWEFAKKLGFIDSAAAAAYEGNTGAFGGIGTGIRSRLGLSGGSGAGSGDNASTPFRTGGKGVDSEVADYIKRAAEARGIDPNVALGVANSEGLKGFSPSKGTWSSGSNDHGTSFGPFQAHIHSNIPGFRARGQGDDMIKAGIDPRDMKNWKRSIDWQLDYAKQHGWSEWHGWRGNPRAGLNYTPSTQTVIKIRPAAGASPATSAGAAVAGSSGAN